MIQVLWYICFTSCTWGWTFTGHYSTEAGTFTDIMHLRMNIYCRERLMSIYLILCFLWFRLTSVRLCSCRSTVTSEWIIVAGLCLLGNSPTGAITGDSGPELFQPSTLLYFVPSLLIAIFSLLWFFFLVLSYHILTVSVLNFRQTH